MVAMSGGVDSSVCALILKEQGYNVVGLHLRIANDRSIRCCGGDESSEVFKKICCHLGIRYYIKDAREVFKKSVIDDFVSHYLSGKTPNPCVECNRVLKFSYLFDIARSLGAEFIATGHYANIVKEKDGFFIERGIDPSKDQSYFLYAIDKDKLRYILFPLGMLYKRDVKKIALKYNLPIDPDKESKDICFIPERDYSLFLKRNGYAKNMEGYIKDTSGKIVARHNGYFHFTIGQRKGLGFSSGKRMYVVDIIPERNEVIVGKLEDCYKRRFLIKRLNLFSIIKDGDELYAQIRYRHTPKKGRIKLINEKIAEFEFYEAEFAITPGQSCVFYEGRRVLGGGIIEKVYE